MATGKSETLRKHVTAEVMAGRMSVEEARAVLDFREPKA